MSCDICGRGSCCPSFHSHEEQERYAPALEAFEKARDLRARIQEELEAEEKDATESDGGEA